MPSFDKILSGAALGEIKAPPPFPPGTYVAVTCDAGERGESAIKKAPQYTWKAKIQQPREDVSQEALMEWKDSTGESINGQEFYVQFWDEVRLARFLQHLGFSDDTPGKLAIAQSAGRQFLATFNHRNSPDGRPMINLKSTAAL